MPRLAYSSTICDAVSSCSAAWTVAIAAHRLERPPVEVAEAHVHRDLGPHALHRAVDPERELGRVPGVHAAVGLVDLDEVGARVHQGPALRVDDRDQVREQRVPVAVGPARPQREHERVGSGDGGLERPRGERPRELELLHDAEAGGRGDLLHHLEGGVGVPVRLAEPARLGERADAPQVIVEADDEAHAPHLAGGEHVDPGTLLVE
jgi:hypothetical protein